MKKSEKQLIPLEKSKRVIYLEKRGLKRRKLNMGTFFFSLLAAALLIYCIYQGVIGSGSGFFLIWAVLAALCMGAAVLTVHTQWLELIPKWIKGCVIAIVLFGGIFFLVVEGLIFTQFHATAKDGADVCLVLGTWMTASGPSAELELRLDKAVEYLERNPDTRVIVTGGQGNNEAIPEAQGMEDYLIAQGIAPERITQEANSANTYENMLYSAQFLNKEEEEVVIVTSGFHLFRAEAIAKKQGYEKIQGLAADCYPGTFLNQLMREFFAIIKNFVIGHI